MLRLDFKKSTEFAVFWFSHGGGFEDSIISECVTLPARNNSLMFRKFLLPPTLVFVDYHENEDELF